MTQKVIVRLMAAILATLAFRSSDAAESIMAVKKIGEYQQQLVAPSALDREAVQAARAALMGHALEKDGALYLYGVLGDFVMGDDKHLLIAFKEPIKWIAEPNGLSDADHLNGIGWAGRVHMDVVALRVARHTDSHGHFGTATWDPWQDAHYSYEGNLLAGHVTKSAGTAYLMKVNGVWSSGNPKVPEIQWTAHAGSWQGAGMFLSPPTADNLPGAGPPKVAASDARSQATSSAPTASAVSSGTPPASSATPGPAASTPAASTPAAPAPPSLIGDWNASFTMHKHTTTGIYGFVDGGGGQIIGGFRYNGFPGCKAQLDPQSAAPPKYVFTVHPPDGMMAAMCGAGTSLRVEVKDANTVHIDQVDSQSGRVLVGIELTRKP